MEAKVREQLEVADHAGSSVEDVLVARGNLGKPMLIDVVPVGTFQRLFP